MKAILIKPDEGKVEEVEFNGTLQHAYELLGVSIIERIELDNDDDIWLDEEGMINGRERQHGGFGYLGGLKYDYGRTAFIGRGLVTGKAYDPEDGETWGDAKSTVAEILARVRLYPPAAE